jgi:alpha-tubulin suppressor-like RCC1 family protein
VDPTTTPTGFSTVPVPVAGLADAKRISAGYHHTCAIRSDDSVVCWGSNSYGQLGNSGATVSQFEPIAVQGIPGPVIDVAAGDYSTCAVLKSGELYCWGLDGNFGLLGGAGDGGSNFGPTRVDSPTRYQRVDLSDNVCGLTAEGLVRCWGSGLYGSLGRGKLDGSVPPGYPPGNVVTPGSNLAALSIGGSLHACTFGGEGVRCWGWNEFCQQGSASTGNPPPNVQEGTRVPGFEQSAGVVGVSAGYGNTCGLFADGTVKCVGSGLIFGEPSTNKICGPRLVPDLNDATQVAVGNWSACAIRKGGPTGKPTVVCWGQNTRGQLGDGTTNPSGTPVQVNLP